MIRSPACMFHVKRARRSWLNSRGRQPVRMRKGWYIVWPDGTTWVGDCPQWASAPVTPGSVVQPIRIMGAGKSTCAACVHGTRH